MHKNIFIWAESKLKIDLKYALSGAASLLFAHIISVLTIILSSYVFANFLSPEVYGEYKYLLTLGITLSIFTFTGAGAAVLQAAAKNVYGFYHYIRRVQLLYSMSITVLAFAGAYYYYIQNNNNLAIGLCIIALLQPAFNNSMLIFQFLYGTQQFNVSARTQATKAIIVTIVATISLFSTSNVLWLLLVYFLSNISVNYFFQFKYGPSRLEVLEDDLQAKKIIQYAKHSSTQNILTGISNQLDKILIFQNLGAADLAMYAFATALPDQLKGLTTTIDALLLPRFAKHSEASIRKGILRKALLYFSLLALCVALYFFMAPHIFRLLYPSYAAAISLSQIYIFGLLSGIGSIPLAALKSRMQNRQLYQFNVFTSLFQISALVILLPTFGLLGAVFARIAYRTCVCGCAFYLYYKQ